MCLNCKAQNKNMCKLRSKEKGLDERDNFKYDIGRRNNFYSFYQTKFPEDRIVKLVF